MLLSVSFVLPILYFCLADIGNIPEYNTSHIDILRFEKVVVMIGAFAHFLPFLVAFDATTS